MPGTARFIALFLEFCFLTTVNGANCFDKGVMPTALFTSSSSSQTTDFNAV